MASIMHRQTSITREYIILHRQTYITGEQIILLPLYKSVTCMLHAHIEWLEARSHYV